MGKKINLKQINFKDKKFIFPLIVVVIVIFIGWSIFGIVTSLDGESEDGPDKEITELQDVPTSTSTSLESKASAMQDSYKFKNEYTAVQGMYDPTVIDSDTTIYTAEEIAYLDSLERIAQASEADILAMNSDILQQNQDLANQKRGLGSNPVPSNNPRPIGNDSSSSSNELVDEMIMYQKLINGEEILTPEQEALRKEEQIRLEERQKVMAELNASEVIVVEKVDNINESAFNTISSHSKKPFTAHNTFKAMVDQTTKVEQGSRVRFVLLEDVKINDDIISKGTHIYGTVSGFSGQRINAKINAIMFNDNYIKVNLNVLDIDGQPGLYVPKSAFRDATKSIASQTIQGGNVNINSSPDNFVGMAAQAIQQAYQGVTQAVSNNITKQRATIKYNTIVYLTNEK
ncbi:conjugative transposon protein TraM [Porphyromonas levii]|uniref:Conjugative transposon protein TraM n=1 Tax=Porphyromonas levii TaxID=28114 RepID=A0A4Y8WM29_9PORP|nr:conjugative transposon protein TraM [Porphyromonas levii]TFH94055.1 conjugative transposon protein TraM [Porphyromonas levii]TFH96824.1 conjugative transposon protein TraM [Porphyromonas levii]